MLEEAISDYVTSRKWDKLLEYGEGLALKERCQFLWAWPSIVDLEFLDITLWHLGIRKVLSIGCGRGLLEWVINESTGEQ
jgi:hypothetical protein